MVGLHAHSYSNTVPSEIQQNRAATGQGIPASLR